MKEHFPDLSIEQLTSGNFRLTQTSGHDERDTVDLHRVQIRHLAERAGLLPHDPNAERVHDLERKLAVLAERVEIFVCDGYVRGEIYKRCSYGSEIVARMDALADLAAEFGLGGLLPTTGDAELEELEATVAAQPIGPEQSVGQQPVPLPKDQNEPLALF